MSLPDSAAHIAIKIALNGWSANLKQAGGILASVPDARFLEPIAPGKNRGIYVLGHLLAVHDNMATLLGGTRYFANLDDLFIKNPDSGANNYPAMVELRKSWSDLHGQLTTFLNGLSAEDWYGPHSRIAQEDFGKQPERNKLSVLASRNIHFGYHLGQLVLLKDSVDQA